MKIPFYAVLHEPGVALGAISLGVVAYKVFSTSSVARLLIATELAHACLIWLAVLFGMHFKKPGIMWFVLFFIYCLTKL